MKRGTMALLLATAAVAPFLSAPASAADMRAYKAPPPPIVEAWNPWMIRIRAVAVVPTDRSTVYIPDPTLNAALAGAGLQTVNPVPGQVLDISNTVIPEIDISYFFTPNIALELILGVTPHRIKGKEALAGLDIGETWLLPPTLTLQYHFTNFGAFKPYIGGGVNYTVFFNSSGANTPAVPALTQTIGVPLTMTNLSLDNAFGFAAQVGFDYMITKNVGVNVDVKKLWLQTDWHGAVSTPIIAGGAPLASFGKVDLDPWLIGGGVTYKF